jgi:transcription initiation factor IIE alpha subunit
MHNSGNANLAFPRFFIMFYDGKLNSADLALLMSVTEKQSDMHIYILRRNRVVISHHMQMGLKGINESLFPIIGPRLLDEVLVELQGPTAVYTDGSKTEGFGRF